MKVYPTVQNSVLFLVLLLIPSPLMATTLSYSLVDTGQSGCYSNSKSISCPQTGDKFDGQDAQYQGAKPSYRDNGDGTVTDLNTDLMWQKTPSKEKSYFKSARSAAKNFKLAGYDDWRLPSVKELYSLIDFRGQSGRTATDSIPYINTDYFDFYYGETAKGERLIDAQYWTATEYTGTTMNGQATTFGVNFADGRIKGYPSSSGNSRHKRFVRYVRGNPDYGNNDFVDNGNGTITDRATGLNWLQMDSGKAMNWQKALAYAEAASYAGFDDWRLPNAKELQSIVDYSKSPEAKKSLQRVLSIDSLFRMSDGDGWYWSSTTHLEHGSARQAVYLSFGQAWGYMKTGGSSIIKKMDVHGSGAQRSDPKAGNPSNYAGGRGPQGDEVRINNYVRLVRGGNVLRNNNQPKAVGSYETRADRSAKISSSSQLRKPEQQQTENGMGKYQSINQQQKSKNKGKRPADMMEHLDQNGDKRISRDEFRGPSNHFDHFDKNRDGYLSREELPQEPPQRHQMN